MKRYRVIISPEAGDHVSAIYRHIAHEASPEIAFGFVSAVLDRCQRLESFPRRGTPRDDLRPGIRTIVFRRRTIVAYRVLETSVEVLGVFHGGQDYETRLRNPN